MKKKIIIILFIILLVITSIILYKQYEIKKEEKIINYIIDGDFDKVDTMLNNENDLHKYIKDTLNIVKQLEYIDVYNILNTFKINKYKDTINYIDNQLSLNDKLYEELNSIRQKKDSYNTSMNKDKYNKLVNYYNENILDNYKYIISDNISVLEICKSAIKYLYNNQKYWKNKDNNIVFNDKSHELEYQDIITSISGD